jgi:hypothetical protein
VADKNEAGSVGGNALSNPAAGQKACSTSGVRSDGFLFRNVETPGTGFQPVWTFATGALLPAQSVLESARPVRDRARPSKPREPRRFFAERKLRCADARLGKRKGAARPAPPSRAQEPIAPHSVLARLPRKPAQGRLALPTVRNSGPAGRVRLRCAGEFLSAKSAFPKSKRIFERPGERSEYAADWRCPRCRSHTDPRPPRRYLVT